MSETSEKKLTRMTVEGPWKEIGRRIRGLVQDGWREVSIEPNEKFTLTTVVLEKEEPNTWN